MSARRTVLILGATSGIARGIARVFAGEGDNLILAGRDAAELETEAADLRLRHKVAVTTAAFDASAFDTHAAFLRDAIAGAEGQRLDGVILCYGFMAEQARAQQSFDLARATIDVNYTSAVSILERVAEHFETTRHGFIAAISSVAGDRGRQSNYIYGSAKAALSTYLQGLRNRLSKSGVSVLTIKPGFVDTAMTWGLPGLFLVASPEQVGRDVYRAVRSGKDELYTPWFWRFIMLIIRSVPERVFKKLKL